MNIKMPVASLHEALRPLSWLVGKWTTIAGTGNYPTINSFTFKEKIEFVSNGQPFLTFKSATWNSGSYSPSYLASGFLLTKPDSTDISFLTAHSMGVVTLESGLLDGTKIKLRSTEIGSMRFFKPPRILRLVRFVEYCCETQHLEIATSMETSDTPLTAYLKATYEKEPF